MARDKREHKAWWRLPCRMCGRPIITARIHTTMCSPTCRKQASRLGFHFDPWPITKIEYLGTGKRPDDIAFR